MLDECGGMRAGWLRGYVAPGEAWVNVPPAVIPAEPLTLGLSTSCVRPSQGSGEEWEEIELQRRLRGRPMTDRFTAVVAEEIWGA